MRGGLILEGGVLASTLMWFLDIFLLKSLIVEGQAIVKEGKRSFLAHI